MLQRRGKYYGNKGVEEGSLAACAFPHKSTPAECNDRNAGDVNKRTSLVPFGLCKHGSLARAPIVLNSEQLLLICN